MYALEFGMATLHPYKIALDLVNDRGFRLKQHTPLRNNLYDLPQIIFNITNVRCACTYSLRHGMLSCFTGQAVETSQLYSPMTCLFPCDVGTYFPVFLVLQRIIGGTY